MMLHIIVTIWVGLHPVNLSMPHLYTTTDERCYVAARALRDKLLALRKDPATRVAVGCYQTDERQI